LDIVAIMGFYSCKTGIDAKNVKLITMEPLGGYYEMLNKNLNHVTCVVTLQTAVVGIPTENVLITSTASDEQNVLMSPPSTTSVTLTENVRGMIQADILA